MTKEQLIAKWGYYFNDYFIADLNAVIDNEIAKVQPEKTNKIEITPHTLVEVNRAFRALKQDRNSYIHKIFSDDGVFDAMEEIRKMFDNYFGEQPQEKPELNPIAEAYERGEKIRKKNWGNQSWYKKYDEKYVIANCGNVYAMPLIDFNSIKNEPEKWELYTEPTQQPPKPFDKERFERIFCAVVASGSYKDVIDLAEKIIKQLDAYYATKNN